MYLELPDSKDRDAVGEAVKSAVVSGEAVRNITRVGWIIDYYYMQGARRFTGLNYQNGSVQARYETSQGVLEYRYDEIVRRYEMELGRLLRLDEGPAVKREGTVSLEGIRNATMAQAVLTTLYADANRDAKKLPFLEMLLMYGTAGLACWGQKAPSLGRTRGAMEVVPPWEILPVPANPPVPSEVSGLVRSRWVPLEWLRSKEGLEIPKTRANGREDEQLKVLEVEFGRHPDSEGSVLLQGSPGSYFGGPMASRNDEGAYESRKDRYEGTGRDKEGRPTQKWVKLSELWVYDDSEVVQRYVAMAGRLVITDQSFEDDKDPPMLPIGVARYAPTAGFYGKSFVSLVRPTNMEVEQLLRRLFENAQDLDQFGYLFIPAAMGQATQQLKSTSRPRIITYEPDPLVPQHKPFNLTPANTGDFPGKVAMMGRSLMQDLSGQSDILSGGAPGRVDSYSALGFLQENANLSLSVTAQSIAGAYRTAYRSLLGMARSVWPDQAAARLTRLDDSLLGIRIDPQSGQPMVEKKSIPHPREVDITIRAALPTSTQQRKNELLLMLDKGIVSQREFRRISYTEGLDFPVGNRAEMENYRKAILNNIVLFNDGQSPGTVIPSENTDNPEIHLEVLGDFMARPEFQLASPQVREAFRQLKQTYQDMIGGRVPQGLENIDQLGQPMPGAGMPGMDMMGLGGGPPVPPPPGEPAETQ